MPPRTPIRFCSLFLGSCLTLLSGILTTPAPAYAPPTEPVQHPFCFGQDTFAFANETVWNYGGGEVRSKGERTEVHRYTRRCFVVTRASVQFWKFARFEPGQKPLLPDQLAERIREVTGQDVWNPILPPAKRVVFPGYRDLHALSAAFPSVFKENIGLGWPIYFRIGNFPIVIPVSRGLEARINDEVVRDLAHGYPTILWLYRFPGLDIDHVVVVYAVAREKGRFVYRVYDPNYADAPKRLEFDSALRTFVYQPTFYFKGGTVDARPVYRGMFH